MKSTFAYSLILTIVLSGVILLSPCLAQAGRQRAVKLQVQSQKIALRQSRVDSGITLTRARTQMYRAQTAANVTGLFSPFGLIANLIGRTQGF